MQLDIHIQKALRAAKHSFQLNVKLQTTSQRIVIVGPSGAGKSLTLKTIAGLMQPDIGHVRLDGRILFDSNAHICVPPQARDVAYVFQDYALFPHLTVRQNLAFSLSRGWFNPRHSLRDTSVEYWLHTFQLDTVAEQFPHELSGGQRQRTALARALVSKPRAWLLDEPFAALDPVLRRSLRAELDGLQRQLQVPMVLITHDPEDAELLGDQVFTLEKGELVTANG